MSKSSEIKTELKIIAKNLQKGKVSKGMCRLSLLIDVLSLDAKVNKHLSKFDKEIRFEKELSYEKQFRIYIQTNDHYMTASDRQLYCSLIYATLFLDRVVKDYQLSIETSGRARHVTLKIDKEEFSASCGKSKHPHTTETDIAVWICVLKLLSTKTKDRKTWTKFLKPFNKCK